MSDKVTTRFAPSPTGYLHLGHAYSAWLNFERGDRFLLRIEDIDFIRRKPECEQAIYEDLAWLGLNWEPPVRRQSDRLPIYEAKLKELHDRNLLYRCFKTRKDIEEAMSAPHVKGDAFVSAPLPADEEQKLLESGLPYAWRLSMNAAKQFFDPQLTYREELPNSSLIEHRVNPDLYGDVALGRKDIGTSYHLACVMDDADQDVTHVIRGQELAEFAGLHAILFHVLNTGKPVPVYHHHKFITGPNGERLAKRDQSITLRALRDQGVTPEELHKRLF